MNALTLGLLACSVAFATASVIPHSGAIVTGPAGIVTSHGAIGPIGHDIGVIDHGFHGHHGGAIIAGPVASAVVAPAVHGIVGHGIIGYGAVGHGIIGHGIEDGVVAVGHHGVTVHGPPTAPAVIAGPSGKIVADGLWGPTSHWGHDIHGVHGW